MYVISILSGNSEYYKPYIAVRSFEQANKIYKMLVTDFPDNYYSLDFIAVLDERFDPTMVIKDF